MRKPLVPSSTVHIPSTNHCSKKSKTESKTTHTRTADTYHHLSSTHGYWKMPSCKLVEPHPPPDRFYSSHGNIFFLLQEPAGLVALCSAMSVILCRSDGKPFPAPPLPELRGLPRIIVNYEPIPDHQGHQGKLISARSELNYACAEQTREEVRKDVYERWAFKMKEVTQCITALLV